MTWGCHSRSNTSRRRQFYALFADCRAQAAEVFTEAPDGGFDLRDPAQQDRGTDIAPEAVYQCSAAVLTGASHSDINSSSSNVTVSEPPAISSEVV